MKKSFLIGLVASLSMLLSFIPSTTYAVSQDECAIWLCLPGGFPSGCSAAESAMEDRIKDEEPPLPPFSSCAVDGGYQAGSQMTYDYGWAVYEPPQTCNGWFSWGCTPSPGRWVKNGSCSTMMCQRKRYIDVFVDGQAVGNTYYF
ncbi:conjugal transfer protein TraL [Methylophaga nitratireducenticrescens]|uniref:conjugal transfer protein TraL n=1 Tax=Methylophaga nitratireducenticrescens TaxID=754476 RepID=UPI000CDC4BE7|nr:conjugal transfer protein TraL [Methylophaga nitratireducenticrescens]AUZ86160.1 conjugal transfer protein TraL [Methylophaga nitratireducenticrescens]